MIYLLLLITIYIWPYGQLLTFSMPNLPFTIYFLDIIVTLLFFSLILSPKRKQILSGKVTKPLTIFLAVATLSLITNLSQAISSGLMVSLLYLFRLVIYPSILYATKYIGFPKIKTPLLISISIFSLLCLAQYLVFPDMRFLKNLGFDDHYFRLIGSLFDPNFTGAILGSLALYFISKNRFFWSLPFIGLLALTFSRASYLMFAVGIGFLIIAHKKTRLFLILCLLGITVYFLPKPFGEGVNLLRTFSIYSRLDTWQTGLQLFAKRPVLGWGYNTLRSISGARFQADNSFIFILATTGLLGFVAFINLLRKLFQSTEDQSITLVIISLLLHSIFNNSLFYIWILAFFWLVLGLGQNKPKEYKSA